MHVCSVSLGDRGMEALITLGAGDMRRTLNILQVCKTPHAESLIWHKNERARSDDSIPCCSSMLAAVRCPMFDIGCQNAVLPVFCHVSFVVLWRDMAGCTKHISPLAVFQMNCLRRICGISLQHHVPNIDMLTRCSTFSVESQLQSKRLGCLGHMFRIPDNRLPKKLLFGEVKGCAPRAAQGLVLMMLQCVIVYCLAQLNLTRMLRTDCFGGTRLALHVPSSS